MVHLTYIRHQLDTCPCILYYYFDDEATAVNKVFFAAEHICSDHQNQIGLQNGEPDWVQSNHTVDTEIAARMAMYEDALEINEQRNLAGETDPIRIEEIKRGTDDFAAKGLALYSKFMMPDVSNVKTISKGVWNTAKEEHDRKNETFKLALDNGPTSLYDVLDGTSRTLKPGITFNFSLSGIAPNRVLTVSFTGVTLTTQQKNTIQNAINNRFGAGKVILQ